jgi:hypothetical protein
MQPVTVNEHPGIALAAWRSMRRKSARAAIPK